VTQTLVKSWCKMTLDDMRADFSISGDIPSPPGARPDFSLFIADITSSSVGASVGVSGSSVQRVQQFGYND